MRHRTPEQREKYHADMRKKSPQKPWPGRHRFWVSAVIGRSRTEKRRRIWGHVKLAEGCRGCGRKDHPAVLAWHHIDPETKGKKIHLDMSFEDGIEEIVKCVVLCHCCHVLLHTGVIDLPNQASPNATERSRP